MEKCRKTFKRNLIITLTTGLVCFITISYLNKLVDILVFKKYFISGLYDQKILVFFEDNEVLLSSDVIRLGSHFTITREQYTSMREATIIQLTHQALAITFGTMLLLVLFLSLFNYFKKYKISISKV